MARGPAQIQPRRRWFDDANVDDTLGRCDDADVTVGRYLDVNPDRVRVLHLGDLGDVAITIGCDLGLSGIHDARGQVLPRPPGGRSRRLCTQLYKVSKDPKSEREQNFETHYQRECGKSKRFSDGTVTRQIDKTRLQRGLGDFKYLKNGITFFSNPPWGDITFSTT